MQFKINKNVFFENNYSYKKKKISKRLKNISNNIELIYFFNSLYGISYSTLNKIFFKTGLVNTSSFKNLNFNLYNILINFIDRYILLKNKLYIKNNLYLVKLQCFSNYRGFRHLKGLPVRGQRTSSNAKTCRSFIFHKRLKDLIKYFKLVDGAK